MHRSLQLLFRFHQWLMSMTIIHRGLGICIQYGRRCESSRNYTTLYCVQYPGWYPPASLRHTFTTLLLVPAGVYLVQYQLVQYSRNSHHIKWQNFGMGGREQSKTHITYVIPGLCTILAEATVPAGHRSAKRKKVQDWKVTIGLVNKIGPARVSFSTIFLRNKRRQLFPEIR